MIAILRLLIGALRDYFKSRRQLQAEVLVLRHQINILRRQVPGRVRPTASDRAIFVFGGVRRRRANGEEDQNRGKRQQTTHRYPPGKPDEILRMIIRPIAVVETMLNAKRIRGRL